MTSLIRLHVKIIIGDLQLVFVMLTLFIMYTQLRSWFLLLTLPLPHFFSSDLNFLCV